MSLYGSPRPPFGQQQQQLAEKLICSRFALCQCVFAVRFSRTNLHRVSFPHLFQVTCFYAVTLCEWLFNKSTNGPTYTFAHLAFIRFYPSWGVWGLTLS